jgi:hypothetical protein
LPTAIFKAKRTIVHFSAKHLSVIASLQNIILAQKLSDGRKAVQKILPTEAVALRAAKCSDHNYYMNTTGMICRFYHFFQPR